MADPTKLYKFLSWNVRGLNSVARQEDVKQVIATFRPDLICMQETKMSTSDNAIIRSALGPEYENNFCFLPSCGASGGILIAAKNNILQVQNPLLTVNTISATLFDIKRQTSWMVTGVYGPQGDLEKKMFLRELRHLKRIATSRWLLIGDFNLIYKVEDKNNGRLNRRLVLHFRRTLNHLQVKEIPLAGRRFTWSNNQQEPTLSRIDRAFCSPD